jgi:hypothetical protein
MASLAGSRAVIQVNLALLAVLAYKVLRKIIDWGSRFGTVCWIKRNVRDPEIPNLTPQTEETT